MTLRLIQYPAAPCKGRITVTKEDLACLDGGEFLNDVIIDFYLKSVTLERHTDTLRGGGGGGVSIPENMSSSADTSSWRESEAPRRSGATSSAASSTDS